MKETVVAVLEHASERFSKWLVTYEIWKSYRGVHGMTERNLTFQVATSFLAHFQSNAAAFMEVPFSAELNVRTDKHLDAYLFSESLALLVESKVVWERNHIRSVGADMDRMSPTLIKQLRSKHCDQSLTARPTYGLVLAETWNQRTKEWWCGNDKARLDWDRSPLVMERSSGKWEFGAISVFQVDSKIEGTLFWLYGISPQLNSGD